MFTLLSLWCDQIFRLYLDLKLDLKSAVIAELGCGTGLGVLCAWLAGFRNIHASDVNVDVVKKAIGHYKTAMTATTNGCSRLFGSLTNKLPTPEQHSNLYTLEEVEVGKSR